MRKIERYRFWPIRWRKAWCHYCGSIVARIAMERHAEWHFLRKEYFKKPFNPSACATHCDITVNRMSPSGTLISVKSGWGSDGLGPG